jgi:Zinc knuckle
MSKIVISGKEYDLQLGIDKLVKTIQSLQINNNDLTSALEESNKKVNALQILAVDKPHRSNFDLVSTIPNFSGSSKENILLLFNKLEQAATLSGWTDIQQFSIVKQKLEKEAHDFLLSDVACQDAANYNDLKAILLERYKLKNTARFYREQLAVIKKIESETIEEYGDRIKQLNHHTYTLGESQEVNKVLKAEANSRALDSFLNGISGSFGEKVRLTFPATFEIAMQTAISIQEALRRNTSENSTLTETAKPLETQNVLAINVGSCTKCGRRGHLANYCRTSTQICYKCGIGGHYANQCNNNNRAFFRGNQNGGNNYRSFNRGRQNFGSRYMRHQPPRYNNASRGNFNNARPYQGNRGSRNSSYSRRNYGQNYNRNYQNNNEMQPAAQPNVTAQQQNVQSNQPPNAPGVLTTPSQSSQSSTSQ